MAGYFLPFLLVLTLYSCSVTGKSLTQEDDSSQTEWRNQDSSAGWRKPITDKPSTSYADQRQNPKYSEGLDQFGKKNSGFNGFDQDRDQQATWRETEYTTTFSPPKGGNYNNKNYYGDVKTTRKPWYVRFKNWTNDKFKQLG